LYYKSPNIKYFRYLSFVVRNFRTTTGSEQGLVRDSIVLDFSKRIIYVSILGKPKPYYVTFALWHGSSVCRLLSVCLSVCNVGVYPTQKFELFAIFCTI